MLISTKEFWSDSMSTGVTLVGKWWSSTRVILAWSNYSPFLQELPFWQCCWPAIWPRNTCRPRRPKSLESTSGRLSPQWESITPGREWLRCWRTKGAAKVSLRSSHSCESRPSPSKFLQLISSSFPFSPNGSVLVSFDAVESDLAIYDAKRFIGKNFTQEELQQEVSRYPFEVSFCGWWHLQHSWWPSSGETEWRQGRFPRRFRQRNTTDSARRGWRPADCPYGADGAETSESPRGFASQFSSGLTSSGFSLTWPSVKRS